MLEEACQAARRLMDRFGHRLCLSVDDFGTGYSALACLRNFPLDVLTLDRSFLQQDGGARNHARFIQAVVDLAPALDLSVVAEDVMAFLKDMRCDEAQGYLFAKPLPLAHFGTHVQATLGEPMAAPAA